MKKGTTLIEAFDNCEAIYDKVISNQGDFTYSSKAAKKADTEYLQRTYELLIKDNKFSNWAYERSFDAPFELRHVRAEHIKNIFSLFSEDVAYLVERLAVILGAVKSTEVAERKEKTIHQILKTLEKLNAELEEVQESIKTLDADVIDFREKLAKEGAA